MPSKLPLLALALVLVLSASTGVYAVPPDTTPPTIETPTINPTSPGPNDPVTVSVVVTDARGVANVSIIYTTNNWTSVNVQLTAAYNSTSGVSTATIPPQTGGGRVAYYVVAYDSSGNKGVNDNAGADYTYEVAPSPVTTITSLWALVVIAAIAAVAMVLVGLLTRRKKATASNQTRSHK